jgi:hypothetical protein
MNIHAWNVNIHLATRRFCNAANAGKHHGIGNLLNMREYSKLSTDSSARLIDRRHRAGAAKRRDWSVGDLLASYTAYLLSRPTCRQWEKRVVTQLLEGTQ